MHYAAYLSETAFGGLYSGASDILNLVGRVIKIQTLRIQFKYH